MYTASKHKALAAAVLGSLVGAFSPILSAGGGEVYCNSIPGPEVIESWLAIPPGGLDWKVSTGIAATSSAPGFPGIGCTTSLYPGSSSNDWPARQSLTRAANHWQNAEVPGSPGKLATSLTFSQSPGADGFNCCTPPQLLCSIVGPDGDNMVNMWEPAASFLPFGGPAVAAVAAVCIDIPTGEILEADIGFNALSELVPFSGIPTWSFVESNVLEGRTYATTTADLSSQPFVAPSLGYADLEGIATHEFGHFIGMGHSLVDGRQVPTSSTVPTMFSTGHTATFLITSSVPASGCGFTTATLDGATTPVGGLLGAGLKTLEPDDISAIGALYPSVDFGRFGGSISGVARDPSGTPQPGVHVVAISKDSPNSNRVGTLSKAGGFYLIEGLEPGDYFVYAEPVDQGVGGMFGAAGVPNYVFDCGPTGCVTGGCVWPPPVFQTEFWDLNEAVIESSPMQVNAVAVSAAMVTTGIDFDLSTTMDSLTVCDLAACTPSARGIRLAPGLGVDPVIEFTADLGTAMAGKIAFLYLGPDRGKRVFGGELLQAGLTGPAGYPIQQSGVVLGSGIATFQVTVTDGMAHNHLVGQVAVRRTGQPPLITNPVSVFVDQP